VAKYRLLSKLAKGGMAEVILAEAVGREGFRKKLVIKRILPHLCDDETFVQMFLQEARLAAQLTHPNIAQIFDLGQFGDQPFISMEYVDGHNFRQVLARAAKQGQRLPLDVIVKVVAYACEALGYAHELVGDSGPLNLIHRDVSPENIMISKGGDVKLVDFGIAKASSSAKLTQIGTVRGKANYLAPEQVLGEPLDGRADLFAICVVLYEALSGGAKPFYRTNPLELMRAIAYEPHVPLRQLQPDVPEALEAIIDKGLAKARDDRWPTCRVLAGELERFLVQKGSYVPASAIADAIRPLFAEDPTQPTPLPQQEEIDGQIMWTDAAQGLPASSAKGSDDVPTPPSPQPAAAEHSAAPQPPNELTAGSKALLERGQVWFGGASPPSSQAVSSSVIVAPDASAPAATPAAAKPPADAGAQAAPGASPAASPKRRWLYPAIGGVALLAVVGTIGLVTVSGKSAKPAPAAEAPAQAAAVGTPASGSAKRAADSEEPAVPVASLAATTGKLSVQSTIEGEVFVGGTKRGTAPLTVDELEPGTYEVEVKNEVFGVSSKGSIEVKAGEQASFQAKFGKGTLVVRAKPFAKVTVDGKSYGVTPIEPIALVEGSHRVILVYDGAAKPESRTKTVRIKARSETKVTEVFE
jgi:serine/threonine-protein kinase